MTPLPPDQAPDQGQAIAGPLIEALLAARAQPASRHFDDVVAAAVLDGSLTGELARELRYWQRASVHEITDYALAVLPAVLPVAMTAVAVSAGEASLAVAAARAVWDDRHAAPGAATDHHRMDAPEPAQAVVSAPDVIVLPESLDGDVDPEALADSDRLRRRMFVAGLTSTA